MANSGDLFFKILKELMYQSSEKPFFSASENLEVLRRYSDALQAINQNRELSPIESRLAKIVQMMMSDANLFDRYCGWNIKECGPQFIEMVGALRSMSEADRSDWIEEAFALAYRFVSELEFHHPGNLFEVGLIEKFVNENLDLFSQGARKKIIFAMYAMPAKIAKTLLNDPTIADFRKLSSALETAEKLKTDWDAELEAKRAHVTALKEGLKSVTSSYNFVGLVNGFQQLASQKNVERAIAFWSLIALAMIMVTPPSLQIAYVIAHIDAIESKRGMLLYTLPTILAIELILIYLFRVVLAQFRSVKAQVLQLELRIALCQFVESYAEYATKVKKNDPHVLAKFEAVVFSSLVPENEGIPSTFDGAEQLSNLIKSFRAG